MSKETRSAIAISAVLTIIAIALGSVPVAEVLNDALMGARSAWNQLESEMISRI